MKESKFVPLCGHCYHFHFKGEDCIIENKQEHNIGHVPMPFSNPTICKNCKKKIIKKERWVTI